MGSAVDKLIAISGEALSDPVVSRINYENALGERMLSELETLLDKKNGFMAFESALHLFSSSSEPSDIGLEVWNSDALWRNEYGELSLGVIFFAEDIFGSQFCIHKGGIGMFDPETGEIKPIASSIEEWARLVLDDFNYWTGHSLAHEWQSMNGRLPTNQRLMPKIPFVCGGHYEVNNLMAIDSVAGMRARANLAVQIKNLPDGAKIEFRITD